MTLEPHPLQPGWRLLDSESFGYRAEDTIEAIALGSSDEGNAQSHTDGLAREGFPRILWEVL